MSYATPQNVADLFRQLDLTKTNTAVTSTKIQEWLDGASAMIDSRIGVLYQLPITSGANPLSFAILKQIESFYVAGIVDDILNSYSDGDKKPMWEKRAAMMLDMYAPEDCDKDCAPKSKLPDAIYLGTSIQQGGLKIHSSNTAPTFTKGGNNW